MSLYNHKKKKNKKNQGTRWQISSAIYSLAPATSPAGHKSFIVSARCLVVQMWHKQCKTLNGNKNTLIFCQNVSSNP